MAIERFRVERVRQQGMVEDFSEEELRIPLHSEIPHILFDKREKEFEIAFQGHEHVIPRAPETLSDGIFSILVERPYEKIPDEEIHEAVVEEGFRPDPRGIAYSLRDVREYMRVGSRSVIRRNNSADHPSIVLAASTTIIEPEGLVRKNTPTHQGLDLYHKNVLKYVNDSIQRSK